MVHTRVFNEYIHFTLMVTTNHIFPVLSIKHLVNQYREPTKPQNLATSTNNSVSKLCVLFCPYVVQKATKNVDTKALNMRHQLQKYFCVIFVGIPQHQKGYLICVPSTRKIFSSRDVLFDETFFCALAYTSRTYSGTLAMQPAV